MKEKLMLYTYQPYQPWLQKSPNYLEYLKEQLGKINRDLHPYFASFFPKERIDYLEREREYFLAEIEKAKIVEIKLEILKPYVNK